MNKISEEVKIKLIEAVRDVLIAIFGSKMN